MNPTDRGAPQAAVHGGIESDTTEHMGSCLWRAKRGKLLEELFL